MSYAAPYILLTVPHTENEFQFLLNQLDPNDPNTVKIIVLICLFWMFNLS